MHEPEEKRGANGRREKKKKDTCLLSLSSVPISVSLPLATEVKKDERKGFIGNEKKEKVVRWLYPQGIREGERRRGITRRNQKKLGGGRDISKGKWKKSSENPPAKKLDFGSNFRKKGGKTFLVKEEEQNHRPIIHYHRQNLSS